MKTIFRSGVVFFLMLFLGCSEEQVSSTCFSKESVIQNRSNKRGVAFNFDLLDDISVLGKGASWSYNWAPYQRPQYDNAVRENEMEFCPMAWNGINQKELKEYVLKHPECKYLLAFNEPNIVEQANMTPQQAASKWGEVKSIAEELGLKIISPAMNYGNLENYEDPIVWLDEFFKLIPLDDVDGIAIHCYMSNPSALKAYVKMYKKYGKPLWLTEFCAWDGLNADFYNVEQQQKFLSDAINYLESDPDVFRYAWFIPRGYVNGNSFPYMHLLTNDYKVELTELGKIFTNISSQDKNTFYAVEQVVEAEKYSSISIADGLKQGWVNGPRVKTTTDHKDKTLELYNFLPNQWVEYQFEIECSGDYQLELRYACFIDSEVDLEIEGVVRSTFELPSTGKSDVWSGIKIPIILNSGKQTLRIHLKKGTFHLNWLRLN